jgi:hypothetical protein
MANWTYHYGYLDPAKYLADILPLLPLLPLCPLLLQEALLENTSTVPICFYCAPSID